MVWGVNVKDSIGGRIVGHGLQCTERIAGFEDKIL